MLYRESIDNAMLLTMVPIPLRLTLEKYFYSFNHSQKIESRLKRLVGIRELMTPDVPRSRSGVSVHIFKRTST